MKIDEFRIVKHPIYEP